MSSPSYGFGVLPTGQSAPIAAIDSTHHGAWVVIATALGLVLGVVCLLIRLYVRVVITPPWSRDDYIQSAATALSLIQSVVVFHQVAKGFGTSIDLIDKKNLITVQASWATSDILYLVCLYLSKASLLFLFLRLTPNKNHNKAAWVTLGLSTTWVIAAIFMVAVKCEYNHPWPNIAAGCTNMFLRWQIIAIIDIIVEVMLVGLAAYLVHNLKMALSHKTVVVIAFFFRLPLIAFAILRLHYLSTGITSLNPPLDLVGAVVWAQIELHYSNFAGTVPCLRPFMMAVNTDYGATEPRAHLSSSKNGYGYGNGSSGFGYQKSGSNYGLSSMQSGTGKPPSTTPGLFKKGRRSAMGADSNFHNGGAGGNTSTVIHESALERNSLGSNDSRKMIIRKEVDFRVEHGRADTRDEEMGIHPLQSV